MTINIIKQIQHIIGTQVDGVWGAMSKNALKKALSAGVVIPITPNITLNEVLHSNTAKAHNIDNIPDEAVLKNLIEASINLWQVARDILGQPMIITSGYRCEALNRRVGGVKNSSHKHGLAIDFRCPKFGSTRAVVAHLSAEFKKRGIAFDQLILEYPDSPRSWVHLGFGRGNRGQVFRIG